MSTRVATQKSFAGLLLASAALLAAMPALAEDKPATEQVFVPKVEETERADGLATRLAVGANTSFGNNRSVVGQTDGSTLNLGLSFDSAADYNQGKHEWRSTLAFGEGLTRTPVLPVFVKSRDSLTLESIYLYHYVPTFGPFARFSLATSMFRGTDVRPELVTYLVARTDGTVDAITADKLTLTGPFRPLTLKESVGPFWRPITGEKANLELRAGAGARQTFAESQLAISDDDKTPELEVKELDDISQLGVEGVIAFWGTVSAKTVTYRVGVEVMVPLAYSDLPATDTRGSLELANIEIGGALSFKLVEWASLDYELKAVREPQLLDAFQVQNNLLLTMGLSAKKDAGEK
jgi:hypothetical protein